MKNHLLLEALQGKPVQRPPVWMMRQAGRYLPEYIALRNKYDFFTRVQTPELACEITLQPIDIVGTDAAILFSDILVVPQAMGIDVELVESKGPLLHQTISSPQDVANLHIDEVADRLQYVYDAIRLCKRALNERVPLIGFAGAPFTILCYMVEGKGSKTFDKAKQFCFTYPEAAKSLLEKITQATTIYLKRQVEAGVDAVQLFDSWSGMLSPADFKQYAAPYLTHIAQELSPLVPVIVFPKGSWYALPDLIHSGASALGIDWTIEPSMARKMTQGKITLQGNMDPCKLLLPPKQIEQEVKRMIDEFGKDRYIANLGHGMLPHIPVEHARVFVDAVKNYV